MFAECLTQFFSGTNTGNALKYVVDAMMASPGNRREVEDTVLLITDGRSRDDVTQPAATLRGTGADVNSATFGVSMVYYPNDCIYVF